jgi:hypothetical protein
MFRVFRVFRACSVFYRHPILTTTIKEDVDVCQQSQEQLCFDVRYSLLNNTYLSCISV